MQTSKEYTGKNEEAAINAALQDLGLTRDQVSVDILALAKSGFLGIGSSPARIKVTYEVPDEPAPVIPQPVVEAPAPKKEVPAAPRIEKKPQPAAAAPVAEEPAAEEVDDDRAQEIRNFLEGLLERMGVKAYPTVAMDDQGCYLVELKGDHLGSVIGRRGETLDAIQQLTGYTVNKGQSKRVRVRVDAEHYRAKREESLERMAHRVADKVLRSHRSVTLEPMNAYERHVIHTALQEKADITTYSVGTEPNRRTVVAYSQGEHR